MAQHEQASQPQRSKGPPPGWRYPDRAKHRSRLRGWLAAVWRETKDNAALVSLVGVLLTLMVTGWLTQQEWARQQELESQRAETAAEVAEQQAQQESLQTYLGDMGELILRDTSPLPEASPDDAVSRLARAKTLTVLGGLGAKNKGILLQFLVETRLIQRVEEKASVITLIGADLSDVKLELAIMPKANLGGADLSGADMRGAYMPDTDLSDARGVTKDQLEQQAATLEGATMPDGSEHH